jgi:hypothetical protein
MTTPLPNAGILAPIPDSFDFNGWMNPPPAKDPTGRTLRIRTGTICWLNKRMRSVLTKHSRDERSKYPDVAAALVFFYGYTPDDIDQQ